MNTSLLSELKRQEADFRRLLLHLLSLKTPSGHPLISAELMIQQILEDCEGRYGWTDRRHTPADLLAYLDGKRDLPLAASDAHVVFGLLHFEYRRLVCGLGQPDWLCAPACRPAILHSDYPVYFTDREGQKEYIFSITDLAIDDAQFSKQRLRRA